MSARVAVPIGAALTVALALAPLALAPLAVGCAIGPDYERPTIGLARSMPEVAAVATGGLTLTDREPWSNWWEVFHDPVLDGLVRDALDANQDLRAALARVQIARSLVRESFAPLLPKISTIGAYQYVRIPPNATGASSASASGAGAASQPAAFTGQPFQTWAGVGALSWELDLWGRVRRSLESQNAAEIATEEDRKGTEISVIADVAAAYFDVGEASAERAIAREAVETREETLAIVRKRVDTGFATELELRRAEGELASARAQVPDAEARRAVAEHRLAILTGRLPDVHFDGRPPVEFETPPEIPVGVPATLLERRPDIRAAEARLVSQNAGIGQAIAGYFPSFTLQGFAGYVSLDLHKIAQPASQFYAVGPVVRLPLFEGGKTYAQVLEAEARTGEAEASYHGTILRAFGEVADAVVRLATDRRIRDAQAIEVEAERRAVEVARTQYEQGLALYLDVLDVQRELLAARQGLVRTQRRILDDLVQLEKALGGGWRELPADSFQQNLVRPFVPGTRNAGPEK